MQDKFAFTIKVHCQINIICFFNWLCCYSSYSAHHSHLLLHCHIIAIIVKLLSLIISCTVQGSCQAQGSAHHLVYSYVVQASSSSSSSNKCTSSQGLYHLHQTSTMHTIANFQHHFKVCNFIIIQCMISTYHHHHRTYLSIQGSLG